MIPRYLFPEETDILDDIKESQRNIGLEIRRLMNRINYLENQVKTVKIESRSTEIETLNQRCADLELDNLCLKDNSEYFKEEIQKAERYKIKLGKLFKKTYKRCNKLDKKLKRFGNNFDTVAKTTISLFKNQKNGAQLSDTDIEELIQGFEKLNFYN